MLKKPLINTISLWCTDAIDAIAFKIFLIVKQDVAWAVIDLANESDEELVRLFRRGIPEAWQVLIERYDRPVMGVEIAMTNMTTRVLRRLAQGGVQDFFKQLFDEIANELKHLDAEPDDFVIWLYRFILKRLQLKGPQPIPVSPAWAIDREEAVLAALVCLGKQYPNYQKAIVLKVYAKRWSQSQSKLIDLTYKEIAKILANDPVNPPSPECVEDWYRRGLQKVREYLTDAGVV